MGISVAMCYLRRYIDRKDAVRSLERGKKTALVAKGSLSLNGNSTFCRERTDSSAGHSENVKIVTFSRRALHNARYARRSAFIE